LQGGFTMDRFGRKRTIQIGAVIATVGGILQAAAMNLPMILVGRIISGWAVGLMSMSVPVYLAECAHPNTRGMIVGITQQMIGVGFIVSTWVGYGSRHTSDSSSFQWRFPLAFQIIPSAFLVIGLIWLPESPRYLIEKDRDDAGLKTLRKLHYTGSNDEWIQNEYNEIRATISAEKAITAPGWAVMFKVPQWRKRLLLGTLIQVFTQLTGISELTKILIHQRIALILVL
jgi:MFS family permease